MVGAVGGGVAWQLGGAGDSESPAAHHLDDAGTAVVHATMIEDAAPALVANAPPADAGVREPLIDAGAIAAVRPGRNTRGTGRGSAAPVIVERAPVAGTGYLQIIGEDNIGAKIVLGGREVGYAPNKLEVPRGHHRLAVIRKDGTRLEAEIDVTEYNTVQHPLRPAL